MELDYKAIGNQVKIARIKVDLKQEQFKPFPDTYQQCGNRDNKGPSVRYHSVCTATGKYTAHTSPKCRIG